MPVKTDAQQDRNAGAQDQRPKAAAVVGLAARHRDHQRVVRQQHVDPDDLADRDPGRPDTASRRNWVMNVPMVTISICSTQFTACSPRPAAISRHMACRRYRSADDFHCRRKTARSRWRRSRGHPESAPSFRRSSSPAVRTVLGRLEGSVALDARRALEHGVLAFQHLHDHRTGTAKSTSSPKNGRALHGVEGFGLLAGHPVAPGQRSALLRSISYWMAPVRLRAWRPGLMLTCACVQRHDPVLEMPLVELPGYIDAIGQRQATGCRAQGREL